MIPVPVCLERGRDGDAVVFLHGIGGRALAFEDELERFSRRRRCLAWDMPGYGESPPLERMTFAALADALAAMLDARGIERAILVGHSMGGMVAQEAVARRPERVAALVLYATSAAFGSPGGDWQRRFLAERLKPLDEGRTPADLAPAVVRGLVGDEPDPRGVERAVACMSSIASEAYRAALHCLVEFDRRESLAAVRCPTLALVGERDRVASPEVMSRVARSIPGARLTILPGAGHLANLEQPEPFAAALGEFLDALA